MKEPKSLDKPQVSSGFAQRELDKCEKQFDDFKENIDSLSQDRMNAARKEETEQQTKLSQREVEKSKDIYLKPKKTIPSKEKFNEKLREDYEFAKEYVQFIAENKEIIGEDITMWVKKFPGMPAEEWVIPVNKPIWAPRYVAEQIKNCTYHRMRMEEKVVGSDHGGAYYGNMIADTIINRLDAHPVNSKKSVFMGASGF